jgi:DNA-binding CsgD family transcriptional regulator
MDLRRILTAPWRKMALIEVSIASGAAAMHDPHGNTPPGLVIGILAVVAVGALVDVALDAPESLLTMHVLLELGLAAFSIAMIVLLASRWQRAQRSLSEAARREELDRAERDEWRRKAQHALAGLAEAIDQQLQEWQLTPAEREVAFGLLRGFSHKRIAALTDRSERTVRQHAIAVYQKARLAGRAELAAFFLEDLLPSAAGAPLTPYHGPDAKLETGHTTEARK